MLRDRNKHEVSPMSVPAQSFAGLSAGRGTQVEPSSIPMLRRLSWEYGKGKEVRICKAKCQREDFVH